MTNSETNTNIQEAFTSDNGSLPAAKGAEVVVVEGDLKCYESDQAAVSDDSSLASLLSKSPNDATSKANPPLSSATMTLVSSKTASQSSSSKTKKKSSKKKKHKAKEESHDLPASKLHDKDKKKEHEKLK